MADNVTEETVVGSSPEGVAGDQPNGVDRALPAHPAGGRGVEVACHVHVRHGDAFCQGYVEDVVGVQPVVSHSAAVLDPGNVVALADDALGE